MVMVMVVVVLLRPDEAYQQSDNRFVALFVCFLRAREDMGT